MILSTSSPCILIIEDHLLALCGLARSWSTPPRHRNSITTSSLFPHPPAPLSGSSEIGGVRAGSRESPGQPLGRPPLQGPPRCVLLGEIERLDGQEDLEDVEDVVRALSGWHTPASIIQHLQNELHNSPLGLKSITSNRLPAAAMPSKFVAKAYVQNEVARVSELLKIEETKTEVIQQANELISAAYNVDPCHVNGAIDFGNRAKAIITRIGPRLIFMTKSWGSGMRRIVEGERGHDWASPREVGSICDAICYIAEQSREAQPWIDRAVSTVIDLPKERNGVVRLVQHIQAVIDEVSWEQMRSVVTASPITSSSTIDGDAFKKY